MGTAVAVDVAASADRAGARALAASGVVLLAFALAVRRRSLVPGALVALGAAYALALEEHSRAVDGDAVLLAPAFLLTAELAYWSLEPRAIRAGREVVLPRIAVLAGLVAATALAAALLVGTAAFDVHGTAVLVGVGVVAATGALALSARLARRG